jgi:hypothetical protein
MPLKYNNFDFEIFLIYILKINVFKFVELLKGRSLDQTYMKNYLIKIKIKIGFIIDESIKCFLLNNQKYGDMVHYIKM